MAPPPPPSAGPLVNVERETRNIIQTFFELLVRIKDFDGPESTDVVANTIKDLTTQFQTLDSTAHAQLPADVALPREVIQYVEDGRNPDIYTREFVEIVVKQNQFMNGKATAFGRFRDVLAGQVEVAFPELTGEVTKIVEGTGGVGAVAVAVAGVGDGGASAVEEANGVEGETAT